MGTDFGKTAPYRHRKGRSARFVPFDLPLREIGYDLDRGGLLSFELNQSEFDRGQLQFKDCAPIKALRRMRYQAQKHQRCDR